MALILNQTNLPVSPSILTDNLSEDELSISDSLCTAAPSLQKEEGRRSVCRGGGDCTQASVKTATVKQFPCPVFLINDSEGPYRTTVCRCLVGRPHYSARLICFGSRGPSEFFSQIRHRNALTEIAWEDAVASEKNRELLHGIVVYRRRVLQTVTSLRVASISRALPPENLKY